MQLTLSIIKPKNTFSTLHHGTNHIFATLLLVSSDCLRPNIYFAVRVVLLSENSDASIRLKPGAATELLD